MNNQAINQRIKEAAEGDDVLTHKGVGGRESCCAGRHGWLWFWIGVLLAGQAFHFGYLLLGHSSDLVCSSFSQRDAEITHSPPVYANTTSPSEDSSSVNLTLEIPPDSLISSSRQKRDAAHKQHHNRKHTGKVQLHHFIQKERLLYSVSTDIGKPPKERPEASFGQTRLDAWIGSHYVGPYHHGPWTSEPG